ncbi:MAG: aminodeoxychorismate lyase, partial [Hyphomicrobium sp.]
AAVQNWRKIEKSQAAGQERTAGPGVAESDETPAAEAGIVPAAASTGLPATPAAATAPDAKTSTVPLPVRKPKPPAN